MIVSRRRKWRRLSLGLLVLVLIGMLTLLLHLWTSAPGDRKSPLHQHDCKSVALCDDNRGTVPRDDKKQEAVPRLDNKLDNNQLHAIAQDDATNAVLQDDSKNAVPVDDNQPIAVPQYKVGVAQDDNQRDAVPPDGNKNSVPPDGNRNAVPPDGNRNAVPPDGNRNAVPPDGNKNAGPLDDNQPDAVSLKENKNNAVPLDESRTAVPPDKNQPKDDNQPDGLPLNEEKRDFKPQYDQASFHGELNATNPSKADLPTNDHPVKLVQPGSSRENIGEKKIRELGPESPSNADLSADEFMGKMEAQGSEAELPTLLQNKTGNSDSSAEVATPESPVPPASGKDVNNTNILSGSLMNEMNRNDFAADAGQNMDFPLPTKSTSLQTNDSSWTAHLNSTDEFDMGLKFMRQNWSNVPSSVGTNGGGIRIVSMSLYGAELRYTIGAIRNAELIKENFPGWTLRIYMESPASSTPRFGLVPRNIVEKLRSLGVDIHYIVPEQDFIPPMMWRFLVADDLSVDYFIIRDSDSRLTERDAAAVSAWIRSGKPFHSIRDHPSHASYAVSGGLWGGRTKELRDILRRSWIDLMRGASSQYLEDMNFLNNVVWPRVQFRAYCSDSVSCDRWPNSHPFPVSRYGYDHVGQVFNEHDLGRPIDIRILRTAGENPRCTAANGS